MAKLLSFLALATLLAGCGGGGGGSNSTGAGSASPATVSVSLTASSTTINAASAAITLTWSSTNATACTASANPNNAGWSGSEPVSGSATVTITQAGTFTLSCSGAGASGTNSVSIADTHIPGDVDTLGSAYAPGSRELAAFQRVNAVRKQCGFPEFTQNTILDKASANHANYTKALGTTSDTEVVGNPGYTGGDYTNRAVAQGWLSSAGGVGGESGGFGFATPNTQALLAANAGVRATDGFLIAVYHAIGVLWPTTSWGVGFSTVNATDQVTFFAFSFGGGNVQLNNVPLTYPCDGSTGVEYESVADENPRPPNIGMSASGHPIWGTPITVVGNQSDIVTITDATLTPQGGSPITLNVLNCGSCVSDGTADQTGELQAFFAVAYPKNPLARNTKYTAVLNGKINGKAFNRTFSFTTTDNPLW
jgi:Cysteine-rich secretory protein family